jgi:hypothetical protein
VIDGWNAGVTKLRAVSTLGPDAAFFWAVAGMPVARDVGDHARPQRRADARRQARLERLVRCAVAQQS